MSDRLTALVKYLRDEADFNRSWTDGRRGSFTAQSPDDPYVARRLELARERDRWADEIERMRPVFDFVVAHNLGSYRARSSLNYTDRDLFDKLGLLIDAAAEKAKP